MTALADNRDAPRIAGGSIPERLALPVAAAKIIYTGALVLTDASGSAIPGTSTGAAGLVASGVANGKADNSSGNAGDISVEMLRGSFPFVNSAGADAISIADRGRHAWVVDDQTVARTSNVGNRALAGVIDDVDADGFVWVRVGSSEPNGQDIYLVAAADLRTSTGFLIKVDGNGKAALAGAGDFAVGVLMNAPNATEQARIRISGYARVVTAATPAKGTLITSNASGKAVAATTAVTNTSDAGGATDALIGSNVCGVLLETGVADTLTAVLVVQAGAVPTTNA